MHRIALVVELWKLVPYELKWLNLVLSPFSTVFAGDAKHGRAIQNESDLEPRVRKDAQLCQLGLDPSPVCLRPENDVKMGINVLQ